MRIYPVIDLKGGVVVHARGGDRERYLPVRSAIASSPGPLAVARAFRSRLGLGSIYVADLDAIAGAEPAGATLAALAADGFELLVDAGVRSSAAASALLELGAAAVVAGLETLPGPGALEEMVRRVGVGRLVFSLDLRDGRPLGDRAAWGGEGAAHVARAAHRAGARRLLLLDLARVGSAAGFAHVDLLTELVQELEGTALLAGGGIRSRGDLALLADAGAAGAHLGTALHEASIRRDDVVFPGEARGRPSRLPAGEEARYNRPPVPGGTEE